jgi:hypothetical protein
MLTLVAHAGVPVAARAAVHTLAPGLLKDGARVGSVGRGIEVGLPNVHLGAASAVLASTLSPALDVGLLM